MKPKLRERIQHQIFLLRELIGYQALDPSDFEEREIGIVEEAIELFEEVEKLLK